MTLDLPKLYFPFGSCRVVNTIAIYLDKSKSQLLNPRDLWFTHYIQEHIQKLNILFSDKAPQILEKDRELVVRYQQKHHYSASLNYGIADSLGTKPAVYDFPLATKVNIVVELATVRSIKIPIGSQFVWGHSTNLGIIRQSPYNQCGAFTGEDEVLRLLSTFESTAVECLERLGPFNSFNFMYVPPIPFQADSDGWKLKPFRVALANMLNLHVASHVRDSCRDGYFLRRSCLDIEKLITVNGGPTKCLQDADHFLPSFNTILANRIYEDSI